MRRSNYLYVRILRPFFNFFTHLADQFGSCNYFSTQILCTFSIELYVLHVGSVFNVGSVFIFCIFSQNFSKISRIFSFIFSWTGRCLARSRFFFFGDFCRCLQAAVGVALQAFMVGVVFAKVQVSTYYCGLSSVGPGIKCDGWWQHKTAYHFSRSKSRDNRKKFYGSLSFIMPLCRCSCPKNARKRSSFRRTRWYAVATGNCACSSVSETCVAASLSSPALVHF